MKDSDRSGLPVGVPVRTCIGCRRRDSWSQLLRVVVDPTGADVPLRGVEVVPDQRRRSGGRGAWLHPDTDCLEQAVRRRAFGRALRVMQGPVDSDAVAAWIQAHSPKPSSPPGISTERDEWS